MSAPIRYDVFGRRLDDSDPDAKWYWVERADHDALSQKLAACERELAAQRDHTAAVVREREAMRDECNALRAEVERLRAALGRHGRHDDDCAWQVPFYPPKGFTRRPCSCGLDAARAALAQPADRAGGGG